MGNFFESDRTVCLVSAELPEEMQAKLSDKFHVIPLPPDESLAKPVRCHPDMICAAAGEKIVFPSAYVRKNCALVDEIAHLSGYSVVQSDMARGERYPSDVGLNAAIGRDFILCRAESTSHELIKAAEDSGKRLINVRQGYAGCSCIAADNAVLTSDRGIFSALTAAGIDVTFADNSGIVLRGYDVGFIGGCGGFYDGTLYFFGDFDLLPCGDAIRKFAARHGLEICRLSKSPLEDYGGMKVLDNITAAGRTMQKDDI